MADHNRTAQDHDGPVGVSVIIPCRNGAHTIGAQLEALAAQAGHTPFEVVVVDNGSTDGFEAAVAPWRARLPGLQTVEEPLRGVNRARNRGVLAARGHRLLFTDADDVVAPGWVAAMVRGLDHADVVGGMVEFRRLNPHLAHRDPRPAIFPEGPVQVPITACVGWRREALERIGLFDESWLAGCDDIEVALRAARAGIRVAFAPDALLHKRERQDPRALMRAYYRYGTERPRLIRAFPDLAERRSTREAAGHWLRIVRTVAASRGRDHQALSNLAKNAGRLVGSLRYRHWAP